MSSENVNVSPVTTTENQNVPVAENQASLFVRTLAGKSLVFSYSGETTISTLKQKIYEHENIAVDQQRLVFSGKQLEDDRTLADYGIGPASTIHLILRLRGGCN